jgi:hypothetical protein
MAIEKSLYELPQGLEAAAAMQEPIEIEIEDPEAVRIGIDGLEIELTPKKETADDFDANLAEYLDERELAQICGDLLGDVESDVASRKDWMQTYTDGIELLGMKLEERSEPWEGDRKSVV